MRRKHLWITLLIVITIVAVLVVRRARENSERPPGLGVGIILPLTGPGAIFAEYIKEGTDLAAEDINKDSKAPITLIYEDSQNQPKEAITVYNKLVSTENPPISIVALSSVARALAPLAEQNEMLQIYIAVALPDITDGIHTFRVYPEANGMAGVMARYNASRLGADTAAVIHINDDFGRVSLEAFQREFARFGGKVIFIESYEPLQTDFRSQIYKLKAIDPAPDVIYLNGYGPSYGAIIKQLKELGVKTQLTADMTLGLPNTLEQVAGSAEGVYFVDGKMSYEFIEKFKRRYGKEPTSYAGYAYDIVNIIHLAAKDKGPFTPDSIREGLHNIDNYTGAMGNITIEPDGNSDLEFVVKQIKANRPTAMVD
jgi:branched-chain amino acid transport system substrate-binding protein